MKEIVYVTVLNGKIKCQLYEHECVKLSLFIDYENLPSHFPVT